jgi:hypothetical protein
MLYVFGLTDCGKNLETELTNCVNVITIERGCGSIWLEAISIESGVRVYARCHHTVMSFCDDRWQLRRVAGFKHDSSLPCWNGH